MATLYTQQSRNVWKTWFLMTLFLVLIIGIGYFLAAYYGDATILYIAVVFSLFMNIFSYWFSDKIVLKMTGAHPASKEKYFDLYTMTENLAITAGLPMPKLYIINDSVPNAFATGRNKDHAVVAVTTGLLQILDKTELEGVIAHELAHIGNRDILLQTIVVVLVGFIAILSDMFTRSLWFGGGDRDNKAGGWLMFVGFALMILSPIIATLIKLAISRKREFLADASGALLTRYPEGLANALQKIESHGRPMKRASNATAHMYISNPFGGDKNKEAGFMARLFMTHPPTGDRIRALQGIEI